MNYEKRSVQDALMRAWSLESAGQWTAENPAAGQCNVTALLVSELFGGRILATPVQGGLHFYNSVRGETIDFTASQFEHPINYEDLSAEQDEVRSGIAEREYEALKIRFLQEYRDTTAF
ncbi:hypothetical protein [uncultured Litoreibacter sp.]|uniref:YunG family protein n=1 Tax=uncultured Litoreibacter sp. TaxID=1392394 RepID=UPI00260CB746|nr:hypothetical protein [uncultured Litoreibacter sp.]